MPGVRLTEGRIRKKTEWPGPEEGRGAGGGESGILTLPQCGGKREDSCTGSDPTDLVVTQSLDVLSCQTGITAGNPPEGLGAAWLHRQSQTVSIVIPATTRMKNNGWRRHF